MRVPLVSLFVCAALVGRSSRAGAEENGDEARYRFISSELERTERSERAWFWVWTASYGGLAASQGAVAWAIKDDGLRADATVGAVKSALGFFAVLLTPQPAIGAPATLRAMDASTAEARQARRVRAEELLHASAKAENFGISWVPHVAAAATNLAGAYVLFHDYKRYGPGWLSLMTGTLVAEVQILTQPTASIGAWNRYVHGFQATERAKGGSFRLACTLSPALQEVVAAWSF